jgi:hypothetical protein
VTAAVLVCGSYTLAGKKAPRLWLVSLFAEIDPSMVVTSEPRGPAAWADQLASESGTQLRRYAMDGRVLGGVLGEMWANSPRPSAGTPREEWEERHMNRDRAMVGYLSDLRPRFRVVVAVLRDTRLKKCESDIIAELAALAGFDVRVSRWDARSGQGGDGA